MPIGLGTPGTGGPKQSNICDDALGTDASIVDARFVGIRWQGQCYLSNCERITKVRPAWSPICLREVDWTPPSSGSPTTVCSRKWILPGEVVKFTDSMLGAV